VQRLIDWIRQWPVIAVAAALATGALLGVPVAAKVDSHFSSDAFCAKGCHVMEGTVYQEFKQSTHGTSSKGVHPTCAQCHISRSLPVAMWEHFLGLSDLYAYVVQGIRTPADFETVRAAGAERVRLDMLDNDSEGCRGCHVMAEIKPEKKRGQRQHAEAIEKGTTCIACHYNLVHKEVEPSKRFLKRAGFDD
jgi:nitrate/TMAO reductase-like tetraheme cytochrome c subunit